MKDDVLHQKTAAALLGVTARRLRQIDHEADPPPKADGKYPTQKFGQWLEKRILSRLTITDDGEVLDYQAERARLTKAQADNEELKFQEKKGDLIPADAVRDSWIGMVMSTRAILLGLPAKIAPLVMAASTVREVEDFARDEVFRALDQLAAEGETDDEITQNTR